MPLPKYYRRRHRSRRLAHNTTQYLLEYQRHNDNANNNGWGEMKDEESSATNNNRRIIDCAHTLSDAQRWFRALCGEEWRLHEKEDKRNRVLLTMDLFKLIACHYSPFSSPHFFHFAAGVFPLYREYVIWIDDRRGEMRISQARYFPLQL